MGGLTMAEQLLQISDVNSGYGKSIVLRGVTMDIAKGEVVGIIGPNGHGKTTLLNTISGFVEAKSGTIMHAGHRLNGLRPERIVQRGIVQIPQGDLVFPEMTILENLLIGGYLEPSQDRRERKLDEVFAIFPKLKERAHQVACTLSGGERRMLAIGRGLMTRSDILMIDEPSLGLAPIIIDQIYEVLIELKRQGRTIILVEENPSRIETFADNVHLIDNGAAVWSGTAEELRTSDNALETYLGG